MDSEQLFIVTIIGGAMLLGLVGIVGGLLHNRRERLLTHQERMKALELGRDLPDDSAIGRLKAVVAAGSSGGAGEGASLALKCFSTAFWVAFWGFIAASQGVWINTGLAIAIVIACATGAISVTSMICGTILAFREGASSSEVTTAKPFIESDAFDVVSHRG
jgi:hypothetical protein